jgi:hypothetical protein
MTFEMQLHVSNNIAPRVMGKLIEFTDEETGLVKKYRETINDLTEKYEVSINYNRRKQLFEVSGVKDDVEKVSDILYELAEEKEQEFEDFIERKKQRRIDHEEYLFRQKKREIKQRVMNAQHDKKEKRETKQSGPHIDGNNPFALLAVDDDEEYSNQLELRCQYDKRQSELNKKNRKIEKKVQQLKNHLKSNDRRQGKEIEETRTEWNDALNALIPKMNHYNSLLHQSFEDYEFQKSQNKQEDDTDGDEDEDEINEINLDDNAQENTQENAQENAQEEQYDDEIDGYGPPRNRASYQRYQYKNKHNNTNKSETWTYAKDNTKKDRGRHNKSEPRHHNRNPEHYDDDDFKEDIENSRRIPTDRIKDKLDELIGSNFKSEFPPLVKK